MSNRVRTAVLISGRGSNLASLLAAAADPTFPARIVAVISNRPEAGGLELARQAGVEAVAIDHRTYGRDRGAHESALHGALVARGVRLVCMAGYMRLLTPFFVGVWSGRLLNIHPSLLPAFPGLHTHQRALQAGVKIHGCTVHWVTEGMDEGPPIAQAAVPVLPGDTPESLGARVLAQEHRLYPVALRVAAGGKPGASAPDIALLNPSPPDLPGDGRGS